MAVTITLSKVPLVLYRLTDVGGKQLANTGLAIAPGVEFELGGAMDAVYDHDDQKAFECAKCT